MSECHHEKTTKGPYVERCLVCAAFRVLHLPNFGTGPWIHKKASD